MAGAQLDETDQPDRGATAIVDCDLHTITIPAESLAEYLPRRYRDRGLTIAAPGYENPHGRHIDDDRLDLANGLDPETAREFHLDAHDIEYAIVTGSTLLMGVAHHPNRDYASAVARAHNEYVANHWLPRDDRLRGSVLVAPQDPEGATELIHEFGARPEFVQVIMGSSSDEAYGHPKFWPVYEAAVEEGLPVAIHTSNDGAGLSDHATPGTPPNYFAWHNMLSSTYMGHVNSLVVEGVFEEFPDLQFVCVEGGFTWVPHLMWRMDKNWKGLRDQAPWLSNPPSKYVGEHIRFTTQPVAEPERPEHLLQLFEMMSAAETLMFASDFPHWDVDNPELILPAQTPADLEQRIFAENALELYDL